MTVSYLLYFSIFPYSLLFKLLSSYSFDSVSVLGGLCLFSIVLSFLYFYFRSQSLPRAFVSIVMTSKFSFLFRSANFTILSQLVFVGLLSVRPTLRPSQPTSQGHQKKNQHKHGKQIQARTVDCYLKPAFQFNSVTDRCPLKQIMFSDSCAVQKVK